MPCIAAWITATIPVEGSAGRRDVIRQGRGLVLSPRLPGRLPVKGSCKGLAPGSRADQFLYRNRGKRGASTSARLVEDLQECELEYLFLPGERGAGMLFLQDFGHQKDGRGVLGS